MIAIQTIPNTPDARFGYGRLSVKFTAMVFYEATGDIVQMGDTEVDIINSGENDVDIIQDGA
jgi:hypothetical protein